MTYKPSQGDIVFLDLKPALVVSNNTYNNFTKIAIVCPITNINSDFPLHVKVDNNLKTRGIIMCEQVKALDVQVRNISFYEKVSKNTLDEVTDILKGFIE